MALKRLPADLTFEAVRNQTSPLAKDPSKVNDSARPQPEPFGKEAKPETEPEGLEEATPSSQGRADAPAIEADRGEPESLQQDRSNVEPIVENKPAKDRAGSEDGKPDAQQDDQPDTEPRIVDTEADRRSRASAKAPRSRGETVLLKARIPPPADGVIEIYDLVKARYGEKAAFKHLLGLAIAGYETAVLAGDGHALKEQPDYPSHPPSRASHRTRAVSKPFFETAKAALDPMGIMGTTVLASAIVKNAIAWYILTEAKK